MSCSQAEPGTAHAKRPVFKDGRCFSCYHSRRKARRGAQRLGAVRRGFGLSEADLAALKDAQRGSDGKVRCRCGRVVGVRKEPCVDHWHGCPFCSGKGCRRCVRGLLCNPCNRFLGYVLDNPRSLLELAFHLMQMPAQKVLTELDRQASMDTSARDKRPLHSG